MADITMCEGKDCNKRKKCYRYTAIPDKFQSWGFFEGNKQGGHCEWFWSNKGMKNRDKKD